MAARLNSSARSSFDFAARSAGRRTRMDASSMWRTHLDSGKMQMEEVCPDPALPRHAAEREESGGRTEVYCALGCVKW